MSEERKKTLKKVGILILALLLVIGSLVAVFTLAGKDEPEPTEPSINVELPDDTKPTDEPTEPKPTEHVHEYIKKITEPTCTERGFTTYTCECGDTYEDDYIDELGHAWSNWATVKKPTTEAEGISSRKCGRCLIEETQSIPKLVPEHKHSYTGKVTKAATCTTEGVKTFNCSCGASYTEKIAKLAHDYISTTKAPTCTEKGYTKHDCKNCDAEYKDNFKDALGHDYNGEITKHPTCTEAGVKTFTCSRCKDTKTEAIAKLNHNYKSVVTEPTCLKEGFTTHTCERCGDSYVDSKTDALGHKYKSKITKEPTCDEDGEKTYTCERCGDTYKEKIDKLGHSYKSIVTEPTCIEKGFTTHTCENCKDKYVDNYVDALGHDYQVKITKKPTCTEAGVKTFTCTRCGDSYTENMDMLDHSYVETVVKPTCTKDGYTKHECSRCGDVYTDNKTDALGHDYKPVSAVEPSCTKEGSITYECTRCGDSYTDVIPMKDHRHITITVAPTCVDKGYTEHSCADCDLYYVDSYVDALGHDYKEKITKEPTCTEKGEKTFTCSRCGDTYKEEIDALGHNYIATVVPPTYEEKGYTEYVCDRCGDTYRDNYVDKLKQTYVVHTVSLGWLDVSDDFNFVVVKQLTEERPDIFLKHYGPKWQDGTEGYYYPFAYSHPGYASAIHNCGNEVWLAPKNAVCTYQDGSLEGGAFVSPFGFNWDKYEVLSEDDNTAIVKFSATLPAWFTDRYEVELGVYDCQHSTTSLAEQNVQITKTEKDTVISWICEFEKNHVHEYESYVSKEPTCEAPGEKTFECGCGERYTEEIPALEHDYGATSAAYATCTEQAYTIYTCQNCGKTEKRSYGGLVERHIMYASVYGTPALMLNDVLDGYDIEPYTIPHPGCHDYYGDAVHIYVGMIDDDTVYEGIAGDWEKCEIVSEDETSVTVAFTSYKVPDCRCPGKEHAKPILDKDCAYCGEPLSNMVLTEDERLVYTITFQKHIEEVVEYDNILLPGEDFYKKIYPETNRIVFTNIDVPENVETIDVSEAQDGGILSWFDNGTMYVTTVNGGTMYANKDCYKMFCGATQTTGQSKFEEIVFDNFNTSKTTNMGYMFSGCSALTSLDISSFDTSNVTAMSSMFYGCKQLTTLDVSNFDTGNVKYFNETFSGCNNVLELDVSNWDTGSADTMHGMFSGCYALTELNVSNFDTSNVSEMSSMFSGCKNIKTLDVSNFDTSNVSGHNVFYSDGMIDMFSYCSSLVELDLSSWDVSNVHSMSKMFGDCYALKSVNIDGWDTSSVKDMSFMFTFCYKLENVDATQLDTQNVENFAAMFQSCYMLKTIDVSGFDTSNATDMSFMFSGCRGVDVLDVSGFNTSKVETMHNMFASFQGQELDVSGFDTSNVTTMYDMFFECNNLTFIDVSNFDTSNVTNMSRMFYQCKSLTELDLTSFDVSNLIQRSSTSVNKGCDQMFYGCKNLTTIYAQDWSTMNYNGIKGSNMFYLCDKLTGAMSYNQWKCGFEYANTTNGYFTVKPVE